MTMIENGRPDEDEDTNYAERTARAVESLRTLAYVWTFVIALAAVVGLIYLIGH